MEALKEVMRQRFDLIVDVQQQNTIKVKSNRT